MPNDRRGRRLGTLAIAAFAVVYVVVVAVAFQPHIVPAYDDGSVSAIALRVCAPLLALPAFAIAFSALRRRKPTVLDVGVGIIAVAVPLDLYLTAIGLHPFSVGWYAARVQTLFSTLLCRAGRPARPRRDGSRRSP